MGIYVHAKPILGRDLHELEGDFLLDPDDLPATGGGSEPGGGGGGEIFYGDESGGSEDEDGDGDGGMDASNGLERLVGIVTSRAISGGSGGGTDAGGNNAGGAGSDGSAHALGSRARAHADAVAALERCCRGDGRGGGGGGGEGGGSATLVSTVTAFNVIHVACHHEAARADRSMRVPKTEWEGAALRNSRVACNSLLPMRSPSTPEERYQLGLERHVANLGEV